MSCYTVLCRRTGTVTEAGHAWCESHAKYFDRAKIIAHDEGRSFPVISAVHATKNAPCARPRELFPAADFRAGAALGGGGAPPAGLGE